MRDNGGRVPYRAPIHPNRPLLPVDTPPPCVGVWAYAKGRAGGRMDDLAIIEVLRDAAEAFRQEAKRLDARAAEPIHLPSPQDIRPTRRHIKRMHDTACLGGASGESLAETLRQRVLERQREGD